MYSCEIDNIMKQHNYKLPSYLYLAICSSSQIDHIRFNECSNDFEIWTKDGWYWKFNVYLKQKEKNNE